MPVENNISAKVDGNDVSLGSDNDLLNENTITISSDKNPVFRFSYDFENDLDLSDLQIQISDKYLSAKNLPIDRIKDIQILIDTKDVEVGSIKGFYINNDIKIDNLENCLKKGLSDTEKVNIDGIMYYSILINGDSNFTVCNVEKKPNIFIIAIAFSVLSVCGVVLFLMYKKKEIEIQE